MRVCRLIHSFSLVWDLSFFLFESVVVLLPSLRPRVLMTRATTAKDDDDDDDGVVVVIIASSLFLFRLSLPLSRAHRVGGSEKPSRQSPIFEKMRETKAAPKHNDGDRRARLSLKKNDTHALLRFRTTTTTVSSLLLLSTDIRKIQNKSGEPETVENARWRIMIRCDEACVFPLEKGKRSEREIQNLCTFFFSIHHRFDIRRGKRPRERKRTPPSSAN